MLQSIRDRAQGLVVGVIVLFICLTFALWGIQSYLDAGRRVIVADVNGQEIELSEFQQAYQRYRQQAQALLGDSFDPKDWQQPEIRHKALDQLIEEKVLSQITAKAGLRVGDPQIQEQLRRLPAFQENGAFSKALYEQRVRLMGFSEVGFEQRMRVDMAIQQLQSGIAGSEFVTRHEAERLKRLSDQKRDIGYTIISADAFKPDAAPAAVEIEAYYKEHKADFLTEPTVSIEYIELSIAALASTVAVDGAKLKRYYRERAADYTAEEQRSANHILIQVRPGSDPKEHEAARERAERVRELAVAGGDFETLAREHSDDIGSRLEGGATGLFGRGVMAPEFEQVVFQMSEGQISEPVKTEFGYHIIQLKKIEPGGLKPFEQVRDDVEQVFRHEQAEQLYFDQAEQFSNLVYEHPDTLNAAAEALGLEVGNTDLLTVAALSEQFSPAVAAAAFSEELLVDGLNSEPIEMTDGRILAIRVAAHNPSRTLALDEVRDDITTTLVNKKARELTQKAGLELIESLRAGEDLESAIRRKGLDWQVVEQADRASPKLNRAIARAAFELPAPAEGAVAFTGVSLGTGDYGVIRIENVRIPDVEALDAGETSALKKGLEDARTAAAWRSFVLALKDLADVETFPHNL